MKTKPIYKILMLAILFFSILNIGGFSPFFQANALDPIPTTTSVIVSYANASLGGAIKITITITANNVAQNSPVPSGTWNLNVANNPNMANAIQVTFGTVTSNLPFTTTIQYTPQSAGDYYFQATYSGDSNYSNSRNNPNDGFLANLLELKWQRWINYTTTIGALATKIGNIEEVIMTAGPSDWSGNGIVMALDGRSGNTIWQVTSSNITNIGIDGHTAFEITDLNNDGTKEVVLATWNGPLVLFANNGSLVWRRTDVPCGNIYPAIADVNGDNKEEIFVAGVNGPGQGYDYITELSSSGQVLAQAYTWHSCFGGLTIGDPQHNGHFILFQGDRSQTYYDQIDTYQGAGMGIRAFDAKTLTPLWSNPNILCSSHAPVLGDVMNDGILDLIVADQNANTIAVLNATDGTILTTNGIYRYGSTPLMPAHSQITVADLYGDGHLEVIDNGYLATDGSMIATEPVIFDLTTWTLRDKLPVFATEPPKVGDINGDGKLDIIVVANGTYKNSNIYGNAITSGSDIFIFSYNQTSKSMGLLSRTTNLLGANAFTLLQDVNGNGFKDLVLTSGSGQIYMFETPAAEPSQPIRSDKQFYSEQRDGAAVYVPPPIPYVPSITNEQPVNGAVNQQPNPKLSIYATSFQKRAMDITFFSNTTGIWQPIGSYKGVGNGIYSIATDNMNSPGTTYSWKTTIDDGVSSVTSMFCFTTLSNPPSQGNPVLVSNNGTLTASNSSTADISNNQVSNIYNWIANGAPITALNLPFDTRTSANPMSADTIFSDSFEDNVNKWNFGNAANSWSLTNRYSHSGTYAVGITGPSSSATLTTEPIDASSDEGISISFYYRSHDTTSSNSILLQLWNGVTYDSLNNLAGSHPANAWNFYTIQTYNPAYLTNNLRIRFYISSITSDQGFFIDDLTITRVTQTKDYSGNNNAGTIHNAQWINQGVIGGAYEFNGANSFIRIPDHNNLGGNESWTAISIEFWAKPSTYSNGAIILSKNIAGDNSSSYTIGFTANGKPNTLFWAVNTGSGLIQNSIITPLIPGNWYHIIATYQSGTGLTLYLNGTHQSTTPLSGKITYYSTLNSIFRAPLFIGCNGGGTTQNYFKGAIDEFKIYTNCLSSAQANQNYLDSEKGSSSKSTIVPQETSEGGNWQVEVTPNNGFADGPQEKSNIISLSSPTNSATTTTPSSPTPSAGPTSSPTPTANPTQLPTATPSTPPTKKSSTDLTPYIIIIIIAIAPAILAIALMLKKKLKPTY